jgi:hypothetical protein
MRMSGNCGVFATYFSHGYDLFAPGVFALANPAVSWTFTPRLRSVPGKPGKILPWQVPGIIHRKVCGAGGASSAHGSGSERGFAPDSERHNKCSRREKPAPETRRFLNFSIPAHRRAVADVSGPMEHRRRRGFRVAASVKRSLRYSAARRGELSTLSTPKMCGSAVNPGGAAARKDFERWAVVFRLMGGDHARGG